MILLLRAVGVKKKKKNSRLGAKKKFFLRVSFCEIIIIKKKRKIGERAFDERRELLVSLLGGA